jgi:hypothetical protein
MIKMKEYTTSLHLAHFVKIIWHIVHMTFSLSPSPNIMNLFNNWSNGMLYVDPNSIRRLTTERSEARRREAWAEAKGGGQPLAV